MFNILFIYYSIHMAMAMETESNTVKISLTNKFSWDKYEKYVKKNIPNIYIVYL